MLYESHSDVYVAVDLQLFWPYSIRGEKIIGLSASNNLIKKISLRSTQLLGF